MHVQCTYNLHPLTTSSRAHMRTREQAQIPVKQPKCCLTSTQTKQPPKIQDGVLQIQINSSLKIQNGVSPKSTTAR